MCSAHPRSRGEHPDLSTAHATACGSSPLARGTLYTSPRPLGYCPAHPRSRGEHYSSHPGADVIIGSSPLARGTPNNEDKHWGRVRLIPARAGNTPTATITVKVSTAHPRSRGEHLCSGCLLSEGKGSSPLARGAPQLSLNVVPLFGLIPARAGSTAISEISFWYQRGSSPLARGAQQGLQAGTGSGGLIPARAGST